jgi:hypothetical protein
MLDAIKDSYAEILHTLVRLPDWLTASALVIGGVLLALAANALIVRTIRNTLGVRHPKTRSLLTRSKGPLRLALIVLALSLVVRIAPIGDTAATVFGSILNVAFVALLGSSRSRSVRRSICAASASMPRTTCSRASTSPRSGSSSAQPTR